MTSVTPVNSGTPLGARHTGRPFAVPQVYVAGQPPHGSALPPAPPVPVFVDVDEELVEVDVELDELDDVLAPPAAVVVVAAPPAPPALAPPAPPLADVVAWVEAPFAGSVLLELELQAASERPRNRTACFIVHEGSVRRPRERAPIAPRGLSPRGLAVRGATPRRRLRAWWRRSAASGSNGAMDRTRPEPAPRSPWPDRLARALACVVFGAFVVSDLKQIAWLWPRRVVPLLAPLVWQRMATKASAAAFALLVVALFVARRPATRSAAGLFPRVVALAGAFAYPLWLEALERFGYVAPSRDAGLVIGGTSLVLVGYVLAFVALAWLGRSFSIQPEARRLVTTGPYAIVRHPLYLAETIAAAGMAMHYGSRPAWAAFAVQLALQALRADYEEEVLAAAFGAEFEAYRARTKKFVPLVY
jgi:protein-S-isoprenylcysteine O-methyltransferase Ste14